MDEKEKGVEAKQVSNGEICRPRQKEKQRQGRRMRLHVKNHCVKYWEGEGLISLFFVVGLVMPNHQHHLCFFRPSHGGRTLFLPWSFDAKMLKIKYLFIENLNTGKNTYKTHN